MSGQASARPVVDFDHHSPGHARDWAARYGELRATCPVAWTEAHGGYWVVSRHAELAEVARDDETFSSDHDLDRSRNGYRGINIPELPGRPIPIEMDPPEFDAYRRVFNPPFAPAATERWEAFVRNATTACLDRVVESGRLDFVRDLANPVPALLTLRMVGLPLEDWPKYSEPFHEIVYAPPGSPEADHAATGVLWCIESVLEVVARRRREPAEDLITYLTQQEIDGAPISDERVADMIMLIFAGGFDTVTGLIANALLWLHEHHDERQRLIDDPGLLGVATEEFLRYFSPQQALARTATRAVEIGGQHIRAGERVLLSWAAANRDPEVFERPDTLMLDRFPNRHAAFGLGIHRCLGSNVARLEFRTLLREALRRMPDYVIDSRGAERYESIGIVNGYVRMPATFTPGERVGSPLAGVVENP